METIKPYLKWLFSNNRDNDTPWWTEITLLAILTVLLPLVAFFMSRPLEGFAYILAGLTVGLRMRLWLILTLAVTVPVSWSALGLM